ncbi:gustatory receptor for sugar taste 64a [Culex quinquefasciatus]|uniref:gustatory receptor for sugar taste 64a n=1 Tax=Culex quinquefasciatus TaxID=7176 RepID=UPI0018E30C6A|nr:gustatory receptor for sugar taste 64a [Culex quinquefasciatus]
MLFATKSAESMKKGPILVVQEAQEETPRKSIPNDCTAHVALAPIILFGQLFSLMPVSGYFHRTPDKLAFRVRSLRFLYSCVTLFAIVSIVVLFLMYSIRRGVLGLSSAATFIYYTVITLALIEFINLGRNWHWIVAYWTEQEKPFLYYPYSTRKGLQLDKLVKCVASAVIFFAFVEDIMNFISAYKLNELHMKYCSHRDDFWRNFFHREHAHIVKVIPYHTVVGVGIELMMRVAKFTWHYIDVFIICVCLSLEKRFGQFNSRIERFKGVDQPPEVWREIRLDYLRLSELVNFMDDRLSRIILMSCANNMFFISVQLYNIFELKPTPMTSVYFWYSLLFLMSRCFVTLYISASIYEASLKPLELLRDFSTLNWNLDLQRLLDHISLKNIAFSGKRFFYITRPLILAMAGTIVTYELVLLDQVSNDQDTTKDCNF